MPKKALYADPEPSRAEVDAWPGPAVIEFGADWCGWCLGAQPHVDAAFSAHPQVRHLQVADGRGRPLGRSFGVKLWPTLVFLDHGREVARVVRPADATPIRDALAKITAA